MKAWKIYAFHTIAENSDLLWKFYLPIVFVPSIQKKNTAIVRNTNYRKKNKMMFIQKPTEIC
jgi:hypothetical protein